MSVTLLLLLLGFIIGAVVWGNIVAWAARRRIAEIRREAKGDTHGDS